MIKLIGINSEVEGRSFPLDQESILVGRDKTNHIQLNDVSVSTMHCMIVSDPATGTYIKDADSTNGTRINTRDIEEGSLNPGDTLEIGNVLFEVHLADQETIHLTEPLVEGTGAAEPAAAPVGSIAFDDPEEAQVERRTRSLPQIMIPDWAYALTFTVLVLVTVYFVFSALRVLIA